MYFLVYENFYNVLCIPFLPKNLDKKNKSGLEINTYHASDSLIDSKGLKSYQKSSSANNCSSNSPHQHKTSVFSTPNNIKNAGTLSTQHLYLSDAPGDRGGGEQYMLNESVHASSHGGKHPQQQQQQQRGSHHSSNKSSNKSNIHNPINQQLIATSSCQGSYHSLPAGGSSGTPLHDPTVYYLQQHAGSGSNNGSNNSPSSTISHQAAASHTQAYRHSHPGESIALVSRGGSVRARVNSDSKCHANLTNTSKSRDKCATQQQQQQTSASATANNRNNNTKSNNNNYNNNSSNRPSASASESNPLRHIIRQNSKNIEFNRQLSAPTENQNSYNSVYNLHHGGILNNSAHYYHSGSPNTNSLNRTKKKRSFKLNGR